MNIVSITQHHSKYRFFKQASKSFGIKTESSLGGVGDGVVGHHVTRAPHGHTYAVLVVFEIVVRDAGVGRL